jgi:hypothetical protein
MYMNIYNIYHHLGVHENMLIEKLIEKSPQLSSRKSLSMAADLSRVVRELVPAESPEPDRFLGVGGNSGQDSKWEE